MSELLLISGSYVRESEGHLRCHHFLIQFKFRNMISEMNFFMFMECEQWLAFIFDREEAKHAEL